MKGSAANVVEIPNNSGTNEIKPGRGAAKLREAADEVLSRDSKELVEALSKSGQNGNVQSTKFIYELSKTRAATDDDREDAEKIRKMALELANAPQWTGPMPSEVDEETDEHAAD